MKWVKRIGFLLIGVIIVLTVLGTVVLPPMVRPAVERAAEGKGVELRIGSLRVGVIRGTVAMGNLLVGNLPGFENEYLATVRSASVNARVMPLLSGELAVQSVYLRRPELYVERTASGEINLTTLIKRIAGPSDATDESAGSEDAKDATPAAFQIQRITVRDMRVRWTDRSVPGPAELSLEDLDVTVRDLYTPMSAGTMDTRLTLSGRLGDGTQGSFEVTGEGNFLSEQLDFDLTMTLDGVALTALAAYAASGPVVPTGGTVSGTIEATCRANRLDAVAKLHIAGLTMKANDEASLAMRLPGSLLSTVSSLDPDHDVEVTVSGDVRNPQFHVVSAVLLAVASDIMDLGGLAVSAGDAGSSVIEKAGETLGSIVDRLPFGRKAN